MFFCCAPPEDKQPQITITAQEVPDVKPTTVAPAASGKVDWDVEEDTKPVMAQPCAPEPAPEAAPPAAPTPAPTPAAAPEKKAVTVCSTDPFDVQLDKAGGAKLGLALNQDANGGKSLAIANIIDGLVSTYNKTAPREKQILIAGVVTAVDGASGTPPELVKKLGAATKPTLTIQPPKARDVTITKNGAGLGLQMRPTLNAKGEKSGGMTVSGIGNGSLSAEFNAAHPEAALKSGDQIVQVCGRVDIVEAIKANDPVVLTVVSP